MDGVLVTGGCGVLGGYLVENLAGQEVRVASLDAVQARSPVEGCVYYEGDIQDLPSLLEVLATEKPRTVVHLAALLGEACSRKPFWGQRVNVGGTLNVLEACRLSGVQRVLYASTRTVYPVFSGPPHGHPDYVPVPEDHPLYPTRPYEVTKYVGEHLGAAFAAKYGFEFAAFRFALYYCSERAAKPGGRAIGVINGVIRNAVAGKSCVLPRGADQCFDLIYVRDLVEVLKRAALHPNRLRHAAYNVGSGQALSLGEFAQAVKAVYPAAEIEVGSGTGFAPGHYCVLDTSRIAGEFDFVPDFPPEKGIADCGERLQSLLGLG